MRQSVFNLKQSSEYGEDAVIGAKQTENKDVYVQNGRSRRSIHTYECEASCTIGTFSTDDTTGRH